MRIEVLQLTSRAALGPLRRGQVVEVDEMDINALQEARDLVNSGQARLASDAPRVHEVVIADGVGMADS